MSEPQSGRTIRRYGDDGPVLVVGRRYAVALADCCVAGTFTATLTEQEIDDGSAHPDDAGLVLSLTFDNGVTLTEWNGATFTEEPG